ncbi:hypothetical protein, partial [Candidatus Frankia alpina]|uniref:hypothetical protein n=1 Tax=Candidatus Frankia alpina TaxID=2699483 RepID=UPI001A997DE5
MAAPSGDRVPGNDRAGCELRLPCLRRATRDRFAGTCRREQGHRQDAERVRRRVLPMRGPPGTAWLVARHRLAGADRHGQREG